MAVSHRRHPDYGGKMSPTYQSWRCMLARCGNPKHRSYDDYGGAGITVAERWKKFDNFLADMGERPPGTTLGRSTPFSDYGPGECEWQTIQKQNAERDFGMKKDLITVGDVTKPRWQWAHDLGLKYGTLLWRLARGWGDEAYTTPTGARRASRNHLNYLERVEDECG